MLSFLQIHTVQVFSGRPPELGVTSMGSLVLTISLRRGHTARLIKAHMFPSFEDL